MRYELTDYEWTAIKPMLPNRPCGVPRVNDRRVLNGIFWVLRSGAPWRDLPGSYEQGTRANIPPKRNHRAPSASARTSIARATLLSSSPTRSSNADG
jgi:transposase